MKKILGYNGKTLEELIVVFHCGRCGCDFEAGHGDYHEGATTTPPWSTHCPACGALTLHFKEKVNGQITRKIIKYLEEYRHRCYVKLGAARHKDEEEYYRERYKYLGILIKEL